jgi:PIN domain nuclease of toxin-antitoxin system
MRVLLDTYVLLWWFADDRKLSRSAREIITSPNNEIYVSAVTVWEVAIKAALGRIEVEIDDLEAAIPANGFQSLAIGMRHAATVGKLPPVHRDPFDRMLVAQAFVEELRVMTHDRVFERYGLRADGLPPILV